MAVVAANFGFLHPMAFHAAAHREIRLACQLSALRNWPVTFLAGVPRFQVFPMAEVDEAWDLIDAHPLDLAIILPFVAFAADFGLGKSHGLAGVRVGMAFRALEFEIAGVELVAVEHGLLLKQEQQYEDHIAAVRICSAI
jgi:hypothetical protein